MSSLCIFVGFFALSYAYVNIALDKSAYQQNPYREGVQTYDASKGVDGKKSDLRGLGGQCVISAEKKTTAIWWVDLGTIHSIHHIIVYYRTDNVTWNSSNGFTARFLGFSVYVSNTTDRLQGTLCYKDDNFTQDTIPAVFTTTCPVHGQYVIYYNERLPGVTNPPGYSPFAFNEVCEVEVYGCPSIGYYGINCSLPCPNVNCQYCHIETGTCEGCKPGYQGHRCELECTDGMYGDGCQSKCGHCLDVSQCHHVNGTCLSGCQPGYKAGFCDQPCSGGMYGDKCKESCGKCRRSDQCHHINGTCLNGCESGYQGDKCTEDCTDGMYGDGCQSKCGHCLDASQCHHVNGTCLSGCQPGYKAGFCNQPCSGGMYGDKCKELCGKCRGSEQCHHVNGTCLNGCESGYQGDDCAEDCTDGMYGDRCQNKCGHCLDVSQCHHVNGTCLSGCQPGYKAGLCDQPCDGGKYGKSCSISCGNCIDLEQCNHINGTCMNGCDGGFEGLTCTKECDDGYFGPNCIEKCNATCRSCNKTSGICENGCLPGWQGLYCQEECSEGFFGENCNSSCGHCLDNAACHHINGTCDEDCDPGYQGPYCTDECQEDTYGFRCNETCGYCSNRSSCSPVNGTCQFGCDPGYRYFLCKEVCEEGTFGQDCSYKCNATCRGCHFVNGLCLTGCVPGWEGAYCHNASPKKNPNIEGPLIGTLISALVILIVLCLIVLIIKRQRNKKSERDSVEINLSGNLYSNTESVVKSKNGFHDKNDIKDSAKIIQSADACNNEEERRETTPEENIYMNEQFTANIQVDMLDSFIAEKRSKGNEGFKKEYAGLPSGEIYCCDAGKKQENIIKNRFKTTFPYDHSRVKLQVDDQSTSDYINANYIDGPNRPKEYIATQGPKGNTLEDFWRMVWYENVSTIVMLTNLKEGEKVKCTQYWPERNKPISAGQVLVKLIDEKEYAFYKERKLSVSNKQLKKTRVVYQHHYTAWPDHGTPESLCLLTFHHHVINKSTNNNKVPTVVHCSAGVGRTGTYIALDALYYTGKHTGKVNVLEFVKKMRESRVSMVQTFEQYITIYIALSNIFKAPIKMDSSTDFCTKAEKAVKTVQVIQKEFQLLLEVRPSYTGVDYKMAKQNSARNCTDTILPLDKYGLFLSSSVANRGNYINAIFVPSFTNARRFIVTKYPTPDGAVDFLRLLNDHESDTVICMDPVQDIETIRSWLPDESSSTVVTPFTVHCQSKSKTDVICHLIDILQEKNENDSHSVVVVEPKATIGPFENSHETSHFRSLVSAALLSETENPITVVCSDGASMCGVFIAVHNAIQQFDMDGGVDIFTTVRQLQVRRSEFCANSNEYQMVYRALYDHIQSTSESIYTNQ